MKTVAVIVWLIVGILIYRYLVDVERRLALDDVVQCTYLDPVTNA